MNYQGMDRVIQATVVNLYTFSKNDEEIKIGHFNPKNKNHLYLLSVANICSPIFNFPIKIDLPFWKIWLLKRKNRELYEKVKPLHGKNNIETENILGFMRELLYSELGYSNDFSDIYKEYYERKDKEND